MIRCFGVLCWARSRPSSDSRPLLEDETEVRILEHDRRSTSRSGASVGLLLVVAGCSFAEPAAPPDPCVALRAQIEEVHGRGRCVDASECELAPGIGDARPAREGEMGVPPEALRPCGSAVHRDDRAALDALLERWRDAACGPVSAVGSRACTAWSHGAELSCTEGRCVMVVF
jgi:hypothetical protein